MPAARSAESLESVKAAWGLAGRTILVNAARLVGSKNHISLMEAFEIVARSDESAVLLIAGRGPLEDALRAKAAASTADIRLVGELPTQQLGDLVAAADVVCSMSNLEGTPNALLEAMAAGRAVAATAVDGVPEIITHDVEGLLVLPGSVREMGTALVSLVRDQRLRARLGAAARARVQMRNSVDSNVESHLTLFMRILASEGKGAAIRR